MFVPYDLLLLAIAKAFFNKDWFYHLTQGYTLWNAVSYHELAIIGLNVFLFILKVIHEFYLIKKTRDSSSKNPQKDESGGTGGGTDPPPGGGG